MNHRLIRLRLYVLKREPSRRLLLSAIPLFMIVWFMICFEVVDCPPSGPRNRFTAETTEERFAQVTHEIPGAMISAAAYFCENPHVTHRGQCLSCSLSF